MSPNRTLGSFEEFCGGVFWDQQLTWDTEDPDFTACFHKTVFSWVPAGVLFLMGPWEARKYLRSDHRNIPWSFLNLSKLALTIGLVAVTIAELVFSIQADSDDTSGVDYLTPVVYLCSYVFSLFLLLLSLRYGKWTQPAQFMFYLLGFLCGVPIIRTLAKRKEDPERYEKYDPAFADIDKWLITYSFQFGFVSLLFILNLFSDKKPSVYSERYARLTKPCPQIRASYFSQLYFLWADSLLWKGWRNPLETKDLWQINPKYTSRGVIPEFDRHYEQTVADAEKKGEKHSILPAMLWTFGPAFFVGSVQKLVYDLLALASPQLMNFMIDFVTSYSAESGEEDEHWKGYLYAGVLLAILCLQSVILSQYFVRNFLIAMNFRTAVVSTIYRKSLKMSSSARKESTVGEIVNLMSVDVQRFMDLIPYLNLIWSSPVQISIACYFIYQELGNAMFAGLGLMILSLPINAVFATFTRRYQLEQMLNKDKRVKLMNEILGGVKVLKLYGWERSYMEQILGIRSKEIVVLKKTGYMSAMLNFIWISIPFLVTLVCFTTYIFMDGGNILTPDKAFVTLSYLNLMRMPMSMLPMLVIYLVQCKVSLDRIDKYMNNEELSPEAVTHSPSHDGRLAIRDGTFKWDKEDAAPVLKDISVNIEDGSLVAVVGSVGSGKSSLMSALLGEMDKQSGSVNVDGQVAFVPQQAWMQNATLQDNILFSKEMDQKKYDYILESCALVSDINILPGGDQTEIGEKGINLSGGQKQRVSLARAVYSDADIFLLDDPLSAVDSHVGKHIFEKVISHDGLLKSKTRVLVTHGITYLPRTDHIIVLKEGRVSEQGTYNELVARKGDFSDFLLEYMTEADDEDVEEIKQQLEETMGRDEFRRELSRKASVTSEQHNEMERKMSVAKSSGGEDEKEVAALMKQLSVQSDQDNKDGEGDAKDKPGATLIEKEAAETGSVGWDVYRYYMRAVGIPGVVTIVTMQVLYQALAVGTNVWLEVWTDNELGNSSEPHWRNVYLGVYGGFGLAQAIATMVLNIALFITTLNASKAMHKVMLSRVMQSPMAFFDTTPLGRIVNRFAKDVDVCDNTLPQIIKSWIGTTASFLGTVILIIVKLPIFTAVIVPIGVIFYFIQNIYVSTSRQLKRLESISRSPIYSHFGETLTGASTIRAFGLQNKFVLESEQKVDENQVCYYPSIVANRWLAVRLEYLANLIVFSVALFTVISPESIDAADVGLVISYSLTVTQTLTWLVRMTSDVETNIVAVERIKEYSQHLEQEADWEVSEHKPSKTWPEKGAVSFQEYGMRYRKGLDLVVKGITCDITGGEKVGIVGRTGAGKSSLTVALFRLVEPAQGRIVIDGEDISRMALHDLRKKLTIIPQDPVLFSGTLRVNLDPFTLHSDKEVWDALELAHLKKFATALENGLQHEVSEGGENVSVGQRQLICLARALLRKTKVLILDEATAAVDLETDDLIQATIRKEFKDCTVITIAHRLNTIMDYDKILVMDKGEIKEFDSPNALLGNQRSIFYGMAKDANLV